MKMQALKVWLALGLVFAPGGHGPGLVAPPTSGGSGQALLNLENTVALHGYDPVAYFTDNEAVRGSKRILERMGSATYISPPGEPL